MGCVCGVLCSKRLGFQLSIKSHLRKAGLLPLASQETIYLTTQPKHMPSNIFSKAAENPAGPTQEALAVLSGTRKPGLSCLVGMRVSFLASLLSKEGEGGRI